MNNVETLANIPSIVLEGGAAFARIGTAQSTGTRLFCLSGNVVTPGVYEVPFGTTLRELHRPGRRRARRPRAAGGAARRRGRHVRRPGRARPAAHPRGRARREGDARLRASSSRSTTRSTAARSCCASRRSSATSRAASACRAASARCARRRRCTASPAERPLGGVAQGDRAARRRRRRDERRVDLRPRADGVRGGRVGDHRVGLFKERTQ